MLSFRLGRVPVRVHGSFLLVGIVLGWGVGRGGGAGQASQLALLVGWLTVVFVSVLVHELGHALVARAYGLTPQIDLHGMGGTTSYADPEGRVTKRRRIAISLAGPGAGFFLGGLVLAVTLLGLPLEPKRFKPIVDALVWVNLYWGALNLLPVLPLDGGMVLESLAGESRARKVSIVLGVLLCVLALAYGWTWPAILLVLFVVTNVQKLRSDAQERGDEPERARLREGLVALGRDDGAAAARIAREILAVGRSARLRHDAAQLLAWGSILSGDADGAAQALGMFPPELPPSPYLSGAVLNATDHPEEAVLPLEQAWRESPDAATGAQLAHALVRSGRLDQALALLSGRHSSRLGVDAFVIVEKSLFDAGRFAEAAQVGELGFAHHPDPTLAYNAACSFARAARPADAVAWLERAIEAGYRDPAQMEADPDLDSLRGLEKYRVLRERLAAPGAG